MGNSKLFFLGAFIEVPVKTNKTTVKVRTCPDDHCENHGKRTDTNYCSVCGWKIKELDLPKDEEVRLFGECDELGITDRFFIIQMDESDYAVPNIKGKCEITVNTKAMTDMDDTTISNTINHFQKEYNKEISLLEKHYGRSFKVKFGALEYYM